MADEKRVYLNFVRGTLTSALMSGGTSMVSAALAALPTLAADEHYLLTLDPLGTGNGPELVMMTAHTAAASTGTVARGQEDTSDVDHDAGTAWVLSVVRSGLPRAAYSARTGGNVTLNGTSWANFDTGMDLVLPAQAGDMVSVSLSAFCGGEAVSAYLDAVSVVSGSPVNSWGQDGAESGTAYGINAWAAPESAEKPIGGTAMKRLVSGDISSGTVTLRIRARTESADDKTIYASADGPIQFCAVNYGPEAAWG